MDVYCIYLDLDGQTVRATFDTRKDAEAFIVWVSRYLGPSQNLIQKPPDDLGSAPQPL